jgi:mono/diheme cytochrome c family protein
MQLARTAVFWSLLLAGVSLNVAAQPAPEGNPFRGRELFQQKRCSDCHPVWGHGGSLGPEITVAVAGKTWDELLGTFWNHTPRMIDEIGRRGYPWPTLDPQEMADILGYLYYLRLFDDPGDPVRGADTYARLQCVGCHTLAGRGAPIGGPLDRFGAYPAPTPLAQAMWNAGPPMQREQLRLGRPIPQFTGHEMADLQAYIRAEGRRSGREVALLPLPNPVRGAEVYRSKQCGACHDRGAGRAPDITRSALSKTAAEITGLLWNHSYAMGNEMAARGVPFPRFSGSELSDLIAHLYFRGYVGEAGDARRGSMVFAEKGCAACHGQGVGGAPDLSAMLKRTDRAGLASAMWNHAPQMHRLMAEEAPFWPKFEPGEMRDLVAYLRSVAPAAGEQKGK